MADLTLVSTIAAAFTGAWLLGLATQSLRLSPIVGYLLAGVLIGPYTPGFVGDVGLANQLAEIGIILLMFGVGLHFHLSDLIAVKSIAIPGAIGQSVVAAFVGWVTYYALGETSASSLVLGVALAVASTVVLMRVLMDADALETPAGHVVVGWLLVEDVLTVVVLVLIPVLGQEATGGAASSMASIGLALGKLVVFVAGALWLGPRILPWIMLRVARLRSRELFTLTVLVLSVAVATAAYMFFGASVALGAFLAGMLVSQSPVASQVAADALPLRDAFAVLFFVSVGMLFDPSFLLKEPLAIGCALGIVLLVKPLSALFLVWFLGGSSHVALTTAIGLAQIGEFSFILSESARANGLLSAAGHHTLVATAILSITLNPLWFRSLPRIEAWLERQPRLFRFLNARARHRGLLATRAASEDAVPARSSTRRRGIVVGYGPVGRSVDRMLREAGLETVVVDLNIDTVAELQREGRSVIYGDASRAAVLERAGVAHASHLVVTLPRPDLRGAIVAVAREANRDLRILVRAHYLSERGPLEQLGASAAVYEEAEAAIALARLVLADAGAPEGAIEERVRELRLRLAIDEPGGLGTSTAKDAMIPWSRVARIAAGDPATLVFAALASNRDSAVVVEDSSGPIGVLLDADRAALGAAGGDWANVARPLIPIAFDHPLRQAMLVLDPRGRDAGLVRATDGTVLGLLTIDRALDHVVGRARTEPTESAVSRWLLSIAGVTLAMDSGTLEEAIVELVGSIDRTRLPSGKDVAAMVLERERSVSTAVGHGVAIPHARVPGLRAPLVVFGRAKDGLPSDDPAAEPIHLVCLLLTPRERPDLQLACLSRVATVVGDERVRDRLRAATTTDEFRDELAKAGLRSEGSFSSP